MRSPIGVDRMQRNFEPMRLQIEKWKELQLPETDAKLVIYQAFIEGDLDAPKHMARRVHELYFEPQYPEFAPRTMWSLSNAHLGVSRARCKELEHSINPEFEGHARKLGIAYPRTVAI